MREICRIYVGCDCLISSRRGVVGSLTAASNDGVRGYTFRLAGLKGVESLFTLKGVRQLRALCITVFCYGRRLAGSFTPCEDVVSAIFGVYSLIRDIYGARVAGLRVCRRTFPSSGVFCSWALIRGVL